MPVSAARMMMGKQATAGAVDILNDFSWSHAYWVEDPDWTNPGDTNDIADLRDAGSEAKDITPSGGIEYQASYSALNDQPVVIADGTTSRGVTSGASFKSQPNTIVFMGWLDSSHGSHPSIIDGAIVTRRHLLRNYGDSANIQIYAGTSQTVAAGADGPFILVALFNGASSKIWMNGTEYSPGNVGTNTFADIELFAAGGSFRFKGAMGFLGVMNAAISAGELADVEAFAESHYGITIA